MTKYLSAFFAIALLSACGSSEKSSVDETNAQTRADWTGQYKLTNVIGFSGDETLSFSVEGSCVLSLLLRADGWYDFMDKSSCDLIGDGERVPLVYSAFSVMQINFLGSIEQVKDAKTSAVDDDPSVQILSAAYTFAEDRASLETRVLSSGQEISFIYTYKKQ